MPLSTAYPPGEQHEVTWAALTRELIAASDEAKVKQPDCPATLFRGIPDEQHQKLLAVLGQQCWWVEAVTRAAAAMH